MEELLNKLKEPFPANRIHWRVGSTNTDKSGNIKWGDKPMCIPLAYIDARDVMNRLDECCLWQTRHPREGYCELGIKIDGEWVWRGNGAGVTAVEAEKGQYSDSAKRAAVEWGVGRYLYYLPNEWVAMDKKKIAVTPTLPKWALPGFVSRDVQYMLTIRGYFDTIKAIKSAIANNELEDVCMYWGELSNEERVAISRAPTKGGIFTAEERKYMSTDEFKKEFFNLPEVANG